MVMTSIRNASVLNGINKKTPLNYARVTIIDGEQGSGKSMSAVAFGVDATFEGLSAVKLKDGEIVKAEPVRNKQGYALIGYGKLYIKGFPRIMRIPKGSCVIADGVKIFYNGTLYGIRGVHLELIDIIKHLKDKNDTTLNNSILIIDEAYIGADRREGLSPLVKVLSKLSKQLRKRHIHLIMCTPDSTELDMRFQKIEVEHIACSYDEDYQEVTKFIRNSKKFKGVREVSYKAMVYRKYYDTDEIFELPDVQLQRAMAMAQMEDDDED